MPCSKDITMQSTTPADRYLSQLFFATGSGALDGFASITGSESGSFSFTAPTYLTVTRIQMTFTQLVRMPMRFENLGATGGNPAIPSSDPSWPFNPCWAGTYSWQWNASLASSLQLPNTSPALTYSETDSYTNVVTSYDHIKDWRGASGRSYRNWFQFGIATVECPIQLNCGVINSKIPCQNQVIDCDGVNIVRTTNYLVRDLAHGYNGTPAPNIAPVVSSVGGNYLTQFPSAGTVGIPWSLSWDFTGPTNTGFELHYIDQSSRTPLFNLQMLLEIWYTV